MGLLNNFVLDAMDGQKVTGMPFLDISKAFDSINHKILLGRLEHIGLSARSLRWFKSCLADRLQRVCINGEMSETRTIDLGVPQGSILGLLLFNVYINSLSSAITKSELILYADDAVLVVAASTSRIDFAYLFRFNTLQYSANNKKDQELITMEYYVKTICTKTYFLYNNITFVTVMISSMIHLSKRKKITRCVKVR